MNTKMKPLFAVALSGMLLAACDKKEMDNVTTSGSEIAASSNMSANLLYEETIEGSNPFSTANSMSSVGTQSYSLTYGTSPVFTGSKSARFELRETDPLVSDGKRVEVTVVKGSDGDITNNTWYSFAQFLPTDFAPDSEAEIINQWYQENSPATALRIKNDHYYLHTGNTLDPDNRQLIDLGLVAKGVWTQFVFHFIHSNGSDGLIEVWKNGTKILTHQGGNMYSGDLPKWKVGIYKSAFKYGTSDVDKRVLYYDDIRVGGPNATLAEMMGNTTTAPAPEPIAPAPNPTPTPTPVPPTTAPQVVSYTLINASNNSPIMTISNGATISMSAIKAKKINIRANTVPASVGSVYFDLKGASTKTKSDESVPYALYGDNNGDFYSWSPAYGNYTLAGTAYTGQNRTGTAGNTLTLNFTISR